MSFAASAALQSAIYRHLVDAAPVAALLGDAIYDAAPSGVLPGMYLMLGPEEVRDRSDMTGRASEHRLTLTLFAQAGGFRDAKLAAAAVCDALDGAALTLDHGRLVGLRFDRARARRAGQASTAREIDLRFIARIEGS